MDTNKTCGQTKTICLTDTGELAHNKVKFGCIKEYWGNLSMT